MPDYSPTDRVSSPYYGNGVILDPPWVMPLHHLVLFDSGEKWWVLRSVLGDEVVKVRKKREKVCS